MKPFNRFQAYVFRNIGIRPSPNAGLDHWRDRVFGTVLTYALPLSVLVIIPSVHALWKDGLYVLAIYDAVAVLFLAFITLVPGLSMGIRKGICMSLFYGIALALLYYLDDRSPGLLFMVAASVFAILFYELRYSLLFQLLNVLICLGFLVLLVVSDAPVPFRENNTAASWLAVSSNMIFISAILVLLLHHALSGLQQALNEQHRLRDAAERANEELGRVNHELEEFAYVASHDLQEPLRMVISFIDLLRRRLDSTLDEKARQYMDLVQDGSLRMRANIEDLLEFARAGRSVELPIHVDMAVLLNGLRKDLAPSIESSDARLHYSGPDGLVVQEATLRQVLLNLIGNGLKYRSKDEPPVISISAEIKGTVAHFAVTDNGIGIDPQYHARIFRMLQRLHTREEYAGTGMGLSICKKVIERAGGRIWVRSALGQGSSFHFTLPASTAAIDPEP